MKQIVYEDRTTNFRISHIVQKTAYDMNKRHIHKEYELYYLIQGERYYFIDSKTYHVNAGSLVLVPSGTLHKTSSINPSDSHERILLILNEEWINPFLRKTGLPPPWLLILSSRWFNWMTSSKNIYADYSIISTKR